MRTQRDPVLELRAAGRECLCSTAGESRAPSSCLRGAGASAPLGDLRMEPGKPWCPLPMAPGVDSGRGAMPRPAWPQGEETGVVRGRVDTSCSGPLRGSGGLCRWRSGDDGMAGSWRCRGSVAAEFPWGPRSGVIPAA